VEEADFKDDFPMKNGLRIPYGATGPREGENL